MQLQAYRQRIGGNYIAIPFQGTYECDEIGGRIISRKIMFYEAQSLPHLFCQPVEIFENIHGRIVDGPVIGDKFFDEPHCSYAGIGKRRQFEDVVQEIVQENGVFFAQLLQARSNIVGVHTKEILLKALYFQVNFYAGNIGNIIVAAGK